MPTNSVFAAAGMEKGFGDAMNRAWEAYMHGEGYKQAAGSGLFVTVGSEWVKAHMRKFLILCEELRIRLEEAVKADSQASYHKAWDELHAEEALQAEIARQEEEFLAERARKAEEHATMMAELLAEQERQRREAEAMRMAEIIEVHPFTIDGVEFVLSKNRAGVISGGRVDGREPVSQAELAKCNGFGEAKAYLKRMLRGQAKRRGQKELRVPRHTPYHRERNAWNAEAWSSARHVATETIMDGLAEMGLLS